MSKILVEVELPNILAGCEIRVTAVSNDKNCVPIDLDSRVMVEESKVEHEQAKYCAIYGQCERQKQVGCSKMCFVKPPVG